ncbi:MAG: glycosidase, partial [Bacteroidota bacterium]|nr:glycosidase [Bacteroidota bacterium]
MDSEFKKRLQELEKSYKNLIIRKNIKQTLGNGIYCKYVYPILSNYHTPLFWRYDLNPQTNPFLMERFGINAAFNAGAIKLEGKYLLVARVEGVDRKSFFAVAESPNGVDNFKFWDYPVSMPETEEPDTNVYDM